MPAQMLKELWQQRLAQEQLELREGDPFLSGSVYLGLAPVVVPLLSNPVELPQQHQLQESNAEKAPCGYSCLKHDPQPLLGAGVKCWQLQILLLNPLALECSHQRQLFSLPFPKYCSTGLPPEQVPTPSARQLSCTPPPGLVQTWHKGANTLVLTHFQMQDDIFSTEQLYLLLLTPAESSSFCPHWDLKTCCSNILAATFQECSFPCRQDGQDIGGCVPSPCVNLELTTKPGFGQCRIRFKMSDKLCLLSLGIQAGVGEGSFTGQAAEADLMQFNFSFQLVLNENSLS